MTPSLARMIAARSQGLPKPIKWFSIPRLFRYEKPQRGRFREFWQLNLDIVGVEGVEADAEIMAAGVEVLRACGLGEEDFVVRYSDRRLLEAMMDALGVPPDRRAAAYAGLDKLLKGGADAARAELRKAGFETGITDSLVGAVARRDLAGLAGELGWDVSAPPAELVRLECLAEYLDAYGVGAFCEFDAAIVRGLAYYTGVVFEMYDRRGELRALCGGGRFDDLLGAAGGEDLPAVGFGLGEAVLLELLEEKGRTPKAEFVCDVSVIPLSAADQIEAIRIATLLRSDGFRVDLWLKEQSLNRALKRAQQAKSHFAITISSVDRASELLDVRDLRTRERERIDPGDLVSWLKNRSSE
jgi:histidyl-tRNA synthetase